MSDPAYTNLDIEVAVGLREQGPLAQYSTTLNTFLPREVVMVAIVFGFFENSFLED
jgi:hypothetical protein